MAADPRQGLSPSATGRRLTPAESFFYASVFSSARRGSLAELCRNGCTEEEAEEFFQTAFEKVMDTVDPIAREFSAPQMVNFIKRAAWRCMIDDRRRRGQRPEVELGTVHSLSDAAAESPDEVAEEREAVAIGHEALQMLPERDRLIFRQRHQMNLSPEEILQNMPGLSLRTYRKVIQRANSRVLDAFERIEGGSRCREMEAGLLRRYISDECPEAEKLEVRAHLAHCRACRRAQAQMRGYLFDVAGLLAAASVPETSRLARLGQLPARLTDLATGGLEGFGAVTRAGRERLRDLLIRIAGGVPGAGGDATVGQALGATSVKLASVCAAGVAAGACVAAGVVPGVGGIGLISQNDDVGGQRPERVRRIAPIVKGPSWIGTIPTPDPAPSRRDRPAKRSKAAANAPRQEAKSAPSYDPPPESVASTPSEATESGSVTGSEFGAESGQPVSPTPPSSAGSGSSPGSSGSIPQSGGSGEFGEF